MTDLDNLRKAIAEHRERTARGRAAHSAEIAELRGLVESLTSDLQTVVGLLEELVAEPLAPLPAAKSRQRKETS